MSERERERRMDEAKRVDDDVGDNSVCYRNILNNKLRVRAKCTLRLLPLSWGVELNQQC